MRISKDKFIVLIASSVLATSSCLGQGITNKGSTVHVLSGTTITVNGDYINDTKYSGVLESQITLASAASVLNLTGNLVNNAPVNLIDELNSIGPINFTGISSSVSGASAPSLITVNDVTVNGGLSLQHELGITNSITLNGTLDLANSILNLKNTGSIVGETSVNRIFSSGTGTVKYTIPATPNLSDVLGQIGVRLEGPLTGALVSRGHASQVNAGDGSISRYFDVQLNPGGEIQKLRFYYFDNEIPVTITESDLVIYASYDGGMNWIKVGGVANVASNFIELTGLNITNNVRITLSSQNCATPPVVNLGTPSQNFCTGVPKVLDAGNTGSFFSWSTTETTQTISTLIAGNYSVLVRDPRGCENTGAVTLVERPMPVPLFVAGIPCPNLPVSFTNSSSISSGTITYAWDFGDPASITDNSTSQNPSYAYPLAGDYPVSLAVTSDYNCTATLVNTITVFPLPQVDFLVTNACFGQTTIFTNTSTIASGGMTFDWDFGDGTTSTLSSPTKSFPSISTFTVQLKATSNANCITILNRNVGIYHTPIAGFSLGNVCEGVNVPFVNNSSIGSGTLTYQWDFGDVTNSTLTVPVKSYAASGTYSISLIATSDFNCTNQITQPIDIYPNPAANFVVPDNCQDQVFNFANNSTSALGTLSYSWDFDDASASTLINPIKSYSLPGTYNVSLLATTSLGCVNTINKAVTVFPVPLADFTLTDACQDAVFNFINSSSVSTGTLSYDWDFGDMQTSNVVNPSKNYSSSGLFPVLLKATSDKGCVNSKTKVLDVWPLPILDFGSVINTCGTSYTLDALNSGSSYLWSDGTIGQTLLAQSNGTYSVQITTVNNCLLRESVNVTLNGTVQPDLGPDKTVCGSQLLDAGYPGSTYAWSDGSNTRKITALSTGTYSVVITDQNGCVGTDNINVTINPVPIVNLGQDILACANQVIVLDAQNAGSSYLWSDNSTGKTIQPTVNGSYAVTVTNTFGCTGADNIKVTINPMPENKLPVSTIACDKTTLDAGNNGSTFVWSTGATTSKIDVTTTGNYAATVTTAKGCSQQFSSSVTISNSPPVDLGSDQNLCFGQSVILNAGNQGDIYRWSDNSNGKTLAVNKSGIYWAEVRKNDGCFKRDSVVVTIYPEITNSIKPAYQMCFNEARVFDAISPQAVSYQWSSTNGVTSNSSSITINNPDTYWVLTKDQFNCAVTDTVKVTSDNDPITARYLVASFLNVGDSVRFIQLSYPDPVSFNWDFADGLTSTVSDPTHRYLRSGDFNSSLLVIDPSDCRSTKNKIITVRLLREDPKQNILFPFVELIRQTIYPNPTSEILNLELEFNQEAPVEIILCSMDGRIIMSKSLRILSGVIELDVRNQPSGMYILKILENRMVKQMRFIKM